MVVRNNPLFEKVALITGASRGIGSSTSLLFADKGATVAVGYQNSEAGALAVKREIETKGGRASIYRGDVRNADEVTAMVHQVYQDFGRIDILVNCAGIFKGKYLIKTTPDDLALILDTNLKGVFFCMKAVLKYMIAARSGCIINLSSTLGLYPEVNSAPYAVSKAGIIALSQAAAEEYREFGVRINVITPGMIATRMTENAYSKENEEEYRNRLPLRRIGQPGDVASAALFLALAPSYNGEIIEVDGGMPF